MARPAAPALALAATLALPLLAPACGGDQAGRGELERARAACAAAVGGTLAAAASALQAAATVPATCSAGLGPTGAADACPGAPGAYTAPVCVLGFEFCAPASVACSGGPLGGCAYACLARVAAPTPGDVGASSTVCATEFVSGQPYGPVSGRPCP